MKNRIFISYRRTDSAGHSGRLYDSLSTYFGQDRVFIDIDQIQGGDNFVSAIKSTLDQTGAVLAVIGRSWTVGDEAGKRRLDDPDDYVRREIVSAFAANIPVIPVLVQQARMPQQEALPVELKSLVQLNAVVVSDERWGSDIKRLAKILELDVPGSVAEQKFDYLKKWVLGLIFISVNLSVIHAKLLHQQSGISSLTLSLMTLNLILMAAICILLPVAARSAESRSKKLMSLSFVLAGASLLLFAYGGELYSVIANTAILVLLSISTFKPQ